MNSIQKYAVMTGAIDRDNFSYILDVLSKRHFVDLDHIIAILIGLERPLDSSDFPEKSFLDEDRHATFKEYNVLSDMVTYTYPLSCERWFATEKDRNEFEGGASYIGMNYSYSEDDAHKFHGIRILETDGVCSSEDWMKYKAE